MKYWKFFNKFIKAIGVVFLIGGIMGSCLYGFTLYQFISGNNDWIGDITTGVIGVIAFIIVGVIGAMLLKAKPYFPNEARNTGIANGT